MHHLITIEDYFAIENRLFVVLSNYGDALAKNPKLEVIVRGVVESENTGSGKGKYVTEVLKNGYRWVFDAFDPTG
ncbi:hypothetical protein [Haloarcula marina]|uniref:hypothetical protein n=1 Tax=Haloarcula marina TaxID=2961574 RepID=UPI0020B8C9E7|nr:hypothetical protein [Halomicroarcula marina]